MGKDFAKMISEKSDEELVVMLTSERKDYRQEVIDIAEQEFKKRDISEDIINNERLKAERKKIELSAKAEEPLDPGLKAFAFIFPGIILFMFSKKYEVEGYHRKAKELSRFTIYGFCFYIGLAILASL